MEFLAVLRSRYSVRNYKPIEVEQGIVEEIITLASLAPSAGNLQSYKLIIVSDEEQKNQLAWAAHGENSIREAPLSIIVCADRKSSSSRYGDRGQNLYAIQDATIFAAYLQLVAVEFGLATVWIGTFSENRIRQFFNIEEEMLPIAVLPVGYSDVEKTSRRRRKFDELLIRGSG